MYLAKKTLLLVALILLAPLLLVSLASLLLIFGSINPMQLAFVSTFRVENRCTMPLWVTPVGTLNSGKKAVLPQFVTSLPALPAFHRKDIRVDPGGSVSIIYDWDDINFSEIVARNAEGEYRQLVVDPDPPKVNYYRNKQEAYLIEDWDGMPLAADDVLALAQEPDSSWLAWAFIMAGVAILGFYWWLLRVYRRLT